MKIAWIAANFFPDLVGGEEHYSWNIAKELVKQGCEIHFFTQKTKKVPEAEQVFYKKLFVHRVKSYGWFFRLKFWPGLYKELKKYNFDRILVIDYAQIFTFQSLYFARKKKLPFFLMINDVQALKTGRHPLKQKPIEWYDRYIAQWVFRASDIIFVRTNWTINYYLKKFPQLDREKFRVAYSGLNEEDFTPGNRENFQREHHIKGKIILFLGRIRKQKGIFELLKAYSEIKKEIPEAKLVYVGPDEKQYDGLEFTSKLKEIIEKQKIKDVFILGPLYGQKRNDVLAAADVMCLPSTFENFGQCYSQAFAQKTPVIGTFAGGIPEIVHHGRDGFLIKIGDVKKLKTYLIRLLKDEKLNQKMGQSGFEKIKKLSYQSVARDLKRYLRQK